MERFTAGLGRLEVWMETSNLGNDLVVVLGGGERPHIGGAVMATSDGLLTPLRLEGHRELDVLEPLACNLAKKLGVVVLAVGGIHIENATNDEISQIIKNCRELEECI